MEVKYYILKIQKYFELKRSTNPRYSLRALARDLNLSSATLSHILRDKRSLSLNYALGIIKKINLSPEEALMFLKSINSKREENSNNIIKIKLSPILNNILTNNDYRKILLILKKENFLNLERTSTKFNIGPDVIKNILSELNSHQLIEFDHTKELRLNS